MLLLSQQWAPAVIFAAASSPRAQRWDVYRFSWHCVVTPRSLMKEEEVLCKEELTSRIRLLCNSSLATKKGVKHRFILSIKWFKTLMCQPRTGRQMRQYRFRSGLVQLKRVRPNWPKWLRGVLLKFYVLTLNFLLKLGNLPSDDMRKSTDEGPDEPTWKKRKICDKIYK